MGVFSKDKKSEKSERIRIKMTRESICMEDERYAPHNAVIGIDYNSTIKEYINILIERYCPKMRGKNLIWVLSYNNRHLAVFNGTTGRITLIDEKMINMTMKDVLKSDGEPSMYLHYISENSIEETTLTMFKN